MPKRKRYNQNNVAPVSMEMLLGKGLEPVTEELIQELLKQGEFKEDDLRTFQEMNFRYSRERGSFFSPPEGTGVFSNIKGWLK